MLAILACMLLVGAPEANASEALHLWLEHFSTLSAPSPPACGDLNGNCCPPADPDAPLTSAGPEYTCNDPELFCRSRQIAQTNTVPPSFQWERLCLECGKEGNACCPGDSPCEVEGNVCAIFNDEGPSECTTCARAQFALNYAPGSPLREQCEAQNGGGSEDGALSAAPLPPPVEAVPEEEELPTPAPAPAPEPEQEQEPTPAPAVPPPSGNAIAVSPDLMGDALASTGDPIANVDHLCWDVDLSSVSVPPNPGYIDQTAASGVITGDELWAVSFYAMLYANCERQARGTYDFIMFTDEKMMGFQESIYCLAGTHQGFAEDPCAGRPRSGTDGVMAGGAEGQGQAPLIGTEISGQFSDEDDNGNGIWDAHELGRKGALGLLTHGDAMRSEKYSCVYAGIGVHQTSEHLNVLMIYGTDCE